MEENHQVELLQCSLNFSTFIYSFAQFLINYFERRNQTQELSEEELLQSETQVIQSLVLIEKLHIFALSSLLYLSNILFLRSNNTFVYGLK